MVNEDGAERRNPNARHASVDLEGGTRPPEPIPQKDGGGPSACVPSAECWSYFFWVVMSPMLPL